MGRVRLIAGVLRDITRHNLARSKTSRAHALSLRLASSSAERKAGKQDARMHLAGVHGAQESDLPTCAL